MLVEPLPGPACVVTEGPAPVVEPDTLPPPAVTELPMPPADDDEVFGGLSPGFKCTVLQLLLFGPELDVVLPSDDDELDELLLSACAAAAIATARAVQNTRCFIAPLQESDRAAEAARVDYQMLLVVAIAAALLMFASVLTPLPSMLAGALVGVVQTGGSCGGTAGANRRTARALAGRCAAGAER